MLSIVICFFGVGMGVASLLASVIFNMVDGIIKRGRKGIWVVNNINYGYYDYYYWLLVMLSLFNVFYYMFCSRVYGFVADKRRSNESDEKESFLVEEELVMLRNTSR